jgi:DNA replication and repair protein RecF
MHLRWLELRDLRCYPRLRWDPDPGINVLVGPNGSGKTTVVEAVAYLSRLRSFRGVADEALIRTGAEAAIIRGEFALTAGDTRVEAELPRSARRRIQVNGKRPPRFREVAGRLPVITFLPDDLDLVKRGPAGRREYLDDLAALLRPAAGADQQEYDRAMRQRNALLRAERGMVDLASLEAWDLQLAAAGGAVVRRRLDVMAAAAPVLARLYTEFGPSPDPLRVGYESAWLPAEECTADQAAEALTDALARRRPVDLERRVTTVGPHRDDLDLRLGDRPVRGQASQGEQRSVALALRLASYDLVADQFGAPPTLVLDDVFSELDAARAAAVVSRLPGGQVLVTTAREEDVPVTGRRWAVGSGELR